MRPTAASGDLQRSSIDAQRTTPHVIQRRCRTDGAWGSGGLCARGASVVEWVAAVLTMG
jgi:hypothetical protein